MPLPAAEATCQISGCSCQVADCARWDARSVTTACGSVQVSEVKNIMVDNIEKVLERGEKIELLVDKTDNLRFQVRPVDCTPCSTCIWAVK